MVLKLYYDLMSQPSRALYLFLRINKVPYVDCPVALRKGEHFTDEYAQINPFKKVPAIDHDGFKLTESVAILRYLAYAFRDHIPEHWYPVDLQRRARVDEFMAWQHLNIRSNGSLYFMCKYIEPEFFGKPSNPEKLKHLGERLVVSLQDMEDVFLNRGQPFLCGNEITVADLLGSCEVEQPRCLGFDIYSGRPKLEGWMNRVRATLQPHYDQALVVNYKLLEKFGPSKFVAILRYLADTFRDHVRDHWLPVDPQRRARVDEFLAWQHLNIRAYGSLYFRCKYLEPQFLGKPRDDEKLQRHAENLVISLQTMEDIFLNRGKPFLCDKDITVADLLGSCEVEQPRCLGFDVYSGRPKLEAWMNRVRDTLQPHYDQAHVINYKLLEKFGLAKR